MPPLSRDAFAHDVQKSPLADVAYRHYVRIRFVLTQKLVCNPNFQSLELRKHPRVSLEPVCNGYRISGLLVNRTCYCFSQAPTSISGGWLTTFSHLSIQYVS